MTLRFDKERMPQHILSRYEEKANIVVFNNAAKPYIESSRQPEAHKAYLTGLIAKELLGQIYTDPRELTDKVIVFQQRYLKFVPKM